MTYCHRCEPDCGVQLFNPDPFFEETHNENVARQLIRWITSWINHTRHDPHLQDDPGVTEINARRRIVKVIHKYNPQDLYELDQNFKVISVESHIGLYIGDTVVEFNKVDLRGQIYKVYEDLKNDLKPEQFVTLHVLRKDCDQGLLQQHVKVRKDVISLCIFAPKI